MRQHSFQGVFLVIGAGACDFVLRLGVPQSVANAGLLMLHRWLTHEFRDALAETRALFVASIVNGQSPRGHAVPVWVTHRQIGRHVAAILNDPQSFPDPILRIARRDARKPQSSLATAGRGCKDYGEAAAER